jgi:radical SAM superfamily enzyme
VIKGECKDCNYTPGGCLFCSDVVHNGFTPKEKSGEEEQMEDEAIREKEAGHESGAGN